MSNLASASRLALFGCLLGLLGGRAEANITGFGDGTGFTLNAIANGPPTISNGVLTLTNGQGSETRSTFDNTAQDVRAFTAQFTYQDVGGGGADGVSFVIQNGAAGVNAGGVGGSSLGYGGLSRSVAVLLSIFAPTPGTGLGLNGSTGVSTPPSSFGPTGTVALNGGDAIQISLGYDGTTLTETLRDLTTSQAFATAYAVNIPSFTGSNTAFVGFTGATGAGTSTQQISNFTFTNAAPGTVAEPASLALLGVGLVAVAASRRRRKGP